MGSQQAHASSASPALVRPSPESQAKIPIGRQDDSLEREADRIAEAVVSNQALVAATDAPARIQRTCAACQAGDADEHRPEQYDIKEEEPGETVRLKAMAGGGEDPGPAQAGQAAAAVSSGGTPLSGEARAYFEPRFGRDLSTIRIHTDDDARQAAAAIGARAYALGNDVAFASGQFDPQSTKGRRLIAHELAHVVQQTRSHMRRAIRRSPDDEGSTEETLDRLTATIIGTGLDQTAGGPTRLLLFTAEHHSQLLAEDDPASRPRTYGTRALLIMNVYDELKARAETAERGSAGALLLDSRDAFFVGADAPEVPWTAGRATSVEEVPPFDDPVRLENLQQAAANERVLRTIEAQQATTSRRRGRSRRARRGPPPALSPGVTSIPRATPRPPPRERRLGPGGTGTIANARSLLASKSLNDILDEGQSAVAPFNTGTLADHVGEIWFISNRLYLLDNTGHIQSATGSAVRLEGAGLEPGATYFLVPPGTTRVAQRTIRFDFFRVDRSAGRTVLGLDPSSVFDTFELWERMRNVFGQNKAIAMVVARRGARTSGVTEGAEKIGDAMLRMPGYMFWAIGKQLRSMVENPLGVVTDVLVEQVADRAAKYVPEVGVILAGYQVLEFAAWLGDTANIAVYARTDDEIDLAAQIFALRVAEEAIGELISAGVNRAVHGRAGGATPESPEAPGAQSSRRTDLETEAPARAREPAHGEEIDVPPRQRPAPEVETPRTHAEPRRPAPEPTRPGRAELEPPPRPDASVTPETPAPRPAPPSTGRGTTGRQPDSPVPDRGQTLSPQEIISPDTTRFRAAEGDLRTRLTPDQAAALDRLQAAYQRYADRETANIQRGTRTAPVLDPDGWLRAQTSGQPRRDAEALLGADFYASARRSRPRPTMDVSAIRRPDGLDDAKLSRLLTSLQQHSDKVWERLSAIRQGAQNLAHFDPGLFNILKGNVAEALARPTILGLRGEVGDADARIFSDVRVARRNADGTYQSARLFSDGLIGAVRGGILHIARVIEVKAGSGGGQEARSQFFEWREGRFADGDKIIVSDPDTGQTLEFRYAPDERGPGLARGVMSSTPVVITAAGGSQVGARTSQNVVRPYDVRELDVTAEEINFLARTLLEGSTSSGATPPATGASATGSGSSDR